MEDTSKKIIVVLETIKKERNKEEVIIKKSPTKRVITNTERWDKSISGEHLNTEKQWEMIQEIWEDKIDDKNVKQCSLILQNINQKIYGYKSQDILKKKYNPDLFISIRCVIELLVEKRIECHYCKERVRLLYEYVRDPLQWTLDRIDNSLGHINNNLFISCLSCNLKRRTMFHEKYVFTKQLKIMKTG